MQKKNLVHSPLLNWPLGEPVMKDGVPAVKLVSKKREEIIKAVDYIELIFGKEIWSYLLIDRSS